MAVVIALTATAFLVPALFPRPALAAPPPGSGPTFVYPSNGETLPYSSSLVFEVRPIADATGYLWGFFQQGKAVWENYQNERVLSGTKYRIDPGTAAHNAIQPGALQVWVRALVNEKWTDATILDINVAGDSGPSSKPCPNIVFYGLRGSGEPDYDGEHDMGTLAFDTFGQFVSRANSVGVKVRADGIGGPDYPAAPFTDRFKDDLVKNAARHVLLGQEFVSVQKGAVSLEERVNKERRADPAMCFIFAGYSQGAWVIGEYLAREDGKELVRSGKIAGIVLYADPLYDPSYEEAVGGDLPGSARLLGFYSGGKTPYIPAELKGKVRSYCLNDDFVCNFRWESLSQLLADIENVSCLAENPARLFCPHYDYRHSVSHLPVSDDGASFLGQTVLGLP